MNDRIRLAFPAVETSGNPHLPHVAASTTSGSLADWFGARVTVVGSAGSFPDFFEKSLIHNASFAYPLWYDALREQVLDISSFFSGDTFQLANQFVFENHFQPMGPSTQRSP